MIVVAPKMASSPVMKSSNSTVPLNGVALVFETANVKSQVRLFWQEPPVFTSESGPATDGVGFSTGIVAQAGAALPSTPFCPASSSTGAPASAMPMLAVAVPMSSPPNCTEARFSTSVAPAGASSAVIARRSVSGCPGASVTALLRQQIVLAPPGCSHARLAGDADLIFCFTGWSFTNATLFMMSGPVSGAAPVLVTFTSHSHPPALSEQLGEIGVCSTLKEFFSATTGGGTGAGPDPVPAVYPA